MGTSHLSGFATEKASCTLEDILKRKGFQPSKKRSVFITAMRVCAGQQPPGRSLPALMPEGMGPETHLQVAPKLVHPMARPVIVPLQCKIALANQQQAGETWRSNVSRCSNSSRNLRPHWSRRTF